MDRAAKSMRVRPVLRGRKSRCATLRDDKGEGSAHLRGRFGGWTEGSNPASAKSVDWINAGGARGRDLEHGNFI
jgi:hypothetical protein